MRRPWEEGDEPLPALFVSHGAPTLAIHPSPAGRHLIALAAGLPRPRAVLCVSAHWESDVALLDSSARPRTIHDFSGFPPELHALSYPAPGAPDLVRASVSALAAAGIEARVRERGLDHGAWVPLCLMFPAADVPVTQLSVQPHLGTRHHLGLGRALAPLRERGVLILASGSATHALGSLRPEEEVEAPPWVQAFDDWLVEAAERGDTEALLDYRQRAPHAQRNHPSEEHFLPLLVAAGAGGAPGRALHRSATFGVLAMTVLSFG